MEQNVRYFKTMKTYSRLNKKVIKSVEPEEDISLTTKNAVKFLLDGTLRLRVCRYCLNINSNLTELDEIIELGLGGGLYEITIKDMIASFHPFKINNISNFPNKICQSCLNKAMNAYLFTQQCERAERAMRNCFEDIDEKFNKLDPIDPIKKRGKRKMNPNRNVLYVENKNVIDYAKPLINIINTNAIAVNDVEINNLQCQKCWQILPNLECLWNHEASHPKSMWYNCKVCGQSFIKRLRLKQHLRNCHMNIDDANKLLNNCFKCNECGSFCENLGQHLQHIEKHKFQTLIQHVINKKMDKLCALCLENGTKFTDLREIINLYGGYPTLAGSHSIYDIVSKMFKNIRLNEIRAQICESCLNHTISSFVFNCKIEYVRNRLNICLKHILDSLNSMKGSIKTVIIEISPDTILPMVDYDEKNKSKDEIVDENIEESTLEVEVLEDEFRENSTSETDSESELEIIPSYVTKTYSNKKLVNGFKSVENYRIDNLCSEFLTFKEKKITPKNTLNGTFTCPICNKHFISDYFLKRHILKHVYRKVECNKCFKSFPSKFHLFEHIKMIHILNCNNNCACEVCGRRFTSLSKLKYHLTRHRRKICHLCDKVFKTQQQYNIHIQRHAVKFGSLINKEKQTCSFCEKACSNENELSLHVNKVHLQMKPYNCDMCDKSYYTEYNLNSHKHLHSFTLRETCVFCMKVLRCRKDLVVHVRKHIGIKPHQCPVCRQSFYSDNQMRSHMKVFHGGKFWCRLCKAVVKTNSDLKAHISVAHSAL